MKLLISFIFLFTASLSFCQEWTADEKAVLSHYDLSVNDHRGIEFTINSDEGLYFSTLKEGLVYFLENKNVTDLTKMHINKFPENQNLTGAIIGIKEIVDHYLLVSK